eukprot:gb/GECH01011851.1/.p1 GENE.gb/GECH01011851.1/~~gb/GECH01011851.1/.p1  ORF type:complete len:474 (+),score=96.17 gb/GECH01011851.1/:1-1422(+)
MRLISTSRPATLPSRPGVSRRLLLNSSSNPGLGTRNTGIYCAPVDRPNLINQFHPIRFSTSTNVDITDLHSEHHDKLKISYDKRQQRMKRLMEAIPGDSDSKGPVEITEREPSESLVSIDLPFSQDEILRESYINYFGGVRIGRLLEDLDLLAAEVAYKHAEGLNPNRPLTIVTASCDRIDLVNTVSPDDDLHLEGRITWAGRSSMEVRIDVYEKESDGLKHLMCGYFTLVARDKNNKSAPVNKVVPKTEWEQHLFEQGKQKKELRKAAAEKSLMRSPPNDDERLLIHNMFLQSIDDIPDQPSVPMIDTRQAKVLIMHPQERNIHGKTFGGYLMREAFELAWATAYMFNPNTPTDTNQSSVSQPLREKGREPVFLSLDDIHFLKPVEVGSILNLAAKVVFSDPDSDTCQIRVTAKVVHPITKEREKTNVFHFAFRVPGLDTLVSPSTYKEAMDYLEGRRIFKKGKEIMNEKHQ